MMKDLQEEDNAMGLAALLDIINWLGTGIINTVDYFVSAIIVRRYLSELNYHYEDMALSYESRA